MTGWREEKDLVVAGAIMAAIGWVSGTAALVWGLTEVRGGIRSKSWPTVQGTVTDSQVHIKEFTDDNGQPHVDARFTVKYAYEVGGVSYTSERLSYATWGPSVYEAQKWGDEEYRSGRTVTVHYDPKKPEESTLQTGCDASILLGAGIFFGLASIGILIALSVIE